jgi:hypothetical protein
MAGDTCPLLEYPDFYSKNYQFVKGSIRAVALDKTALCIEPSALPVSIVKDSPEELARLYQEADQRHIDVNGIIPSPDIIKKEAFWTLTRNYEKAKAHMNPAYYRGIYKDRPPSIPPKQTHDKTFMQFLAASKTAQGFRMNIQELLKREEWSNKPIEAAKHLIRVAVPSERDSFIRQLTARKAPDVKTQRLINSIIAEAACPAQEGRTSELAAASPALTYRRER